MSFAHPGWLPGGLVACLLLAWLWRSYDRRQQAALARFVSAQLRSELTRSLSPVRRRIQRGLFLTATALSFVALAGPLVGFRWEEVSRRGNEIVFAIDTSRSMSTPDIKPNRLARAKLAIDDFVNHLEGDAIGIVAFAGSAFLVCPMTLDYGAFHESLSAIDTSTIPRGGTNISSAIHEAQAALRRRPNSDRILILVTDGEDLEGSAIEAARAAKRDDGLTIFTVGVGTASGDLIPIPPDQGGGFVKDPTGEFVKSRLDESALNGIAAATGGFYVPLGTQGEGLETIYQRVLGPLAKHDIASRQQKVFTERFQWPLAGALGALLASLLVGTRRRVPRAGSAATAATFPTGRSAASDPRRAAGAAGRAAVVALLLLSHPPHAASASADDPKLQYNLGTEAYRAGNYPQAAQAFQRSITTAPSSDPKRLADQEDAYYNLGNALYRAGERGAQSTPQETLKRWNDAVKAYETALQLRPNDADSKYNRDFVKRKIDELQQNQNQQNKNPNQKPDQNPKQGQNPGQRPPDDPQSSPPGQGQAPGQNPSPGGASPPQDAKNNGQPPPPQNDPNGAQGQPPDKPPGQPPPSAKGAPQGQPQGQPQNQNPAGGNPDQPDADANAADNQHPAGQMSREEARELLDSVKGDERHALLAPLSRRDGNAEPQQPIKNW